jgi:hypothetical protein
MARAPRICVAVIMMENLAHFQRFSSGVALDWRTDRCCMHSSNFPQFHAEEIVMHALDRDPYTSHESGPAPKTADLDTRRIRRAPWQETPDGVYEL